MSKVTVIAYGCSSSCRVLAHSANAPSPEVYRRAREDELGQVISNDIRGKILQYVHTRSKTARHCLIQLEVLHMLYYSNLN